MVKLNPGTYIRDNLGYRLGTRRLKGSMGTVQEAWNQDGKHCAVKMPGKGVMKHALFEHELEAYEFLSGIPGIPECYGIWRKDGAVPLLTLEFIEGKTLKEARDSGLDEVSSWLISGLLQEHLLRCTKEAGSILMLKTQTSLSGQVALT